MDVIIMAAVVGGAISLLIVSKIISSRPKLAYGLMILIPAVFMICAYFAVTTFSAIQDKADVARANVSDDVTVFKVQLKADPDNLRLVSALSGTLIAEERYDEAIALIEGRSRSDMGDERLKMQYGTAFFAKGLMAAENKQYEDALRLMQRAQEVAPEDAPFKDDLDLFMKQVTALRQAEDNGKAGLANTSAPVFDFRDDDKIEGQRPDVIEE